MKFFIKNAITNCGINYKDVPFDRAYEDFIELKADNLAGAIIEAEILQDRDDKKYIQAGCSEHDFSAAPCYTQSLYSGVDEFEAERIEL